jgi:hypothetical protein
MSVGPTGRGYNWRGLWANGMVLAVDDTFSYNGSSYVVTTAHTAATATPPPNANVALIAAAGSSGGVHGSGHISGGSDPIPNAVAGGASGLFSGADKTKLDGVQAGATDDQTAAEILTAIKTVDGGGSGLDADTIDTIDSTAIQLREDKNQINGYPGLDSNGLILPARLGTGTASSSTYLAGDQTYKAITPGYTPPWVSQSGAGAVYGSWGTGDPEAALRLLESGVSLSGGDMGTSNARMVSFILPKNFTVSAVRAWTLTTSSLTMFLAIYKHLDSSRVWISGAFDALVNNWVNLTTNTPFTLDANTRYWMALGNNAGGSTNKLRAAPVPLGTNFYGADNSFIAGGGKGVGIQAQIAVTNGVFPTTMPTIAAATYTAGGAPVCLLVGTPS